jgi:hypothetical protein
MIIKYCIVSHDADIVLRYFNLDTNEYDSMLEYDIAVKELVRSICSELGLSLADIEIYEKFYFNDGFSDYAEIVCYDEY